MDDLDEDVINSKSKGIKIKGFRGTWSVIETGTCNGNPAFLLEHDKYDTPAILVTADSQVLADEVYSKFAELL